MNERYYSDGTTPQIAMEVNPAVRAGREFNCLVRGIVTHVYLKDDPLNNQGETVVDLTCLDGFPPLGQVPLSYEYVTATDGEEWTPDIGAIALVQFIAGNFRLPVVTRFLTPPKQAVTATTAQAPRNFKSRNGTWEWIEKSGTRSVSVALSELLSVTQDWLVTVINGVTTIISKGKITLRSQGTIQLDGIGSGAVKGCVQGDCLCAYTGKPHPMISASVTGSK